MINFKTFLTDPAVSEDKTKAVVTTREHVENTYGKTWVDVLRDITGVLESVEDDTDALAEDDNNFNKKQRVNRGPLLKASELDKVKNRHRDEDKRNHTRQRSEKERAEVSDYRNKDMERKQLERKKLEKIRKGVYECAFIEEVYTHMGNKRFETLLRQGLVRRSDLIRFKLAMEKLNTGAIPTLVERDIFFSVFDKIAKFITEDPVVFTQIHRKAVQTRE